MRQRPCPELFEARVGVERRWMGLKRLSAYVDLSPTTLRGYLSDAAHPLPHYLVGGKLLFHVDEIDRWVKGFSRTNANVGKLVDELLGDIKRPLTQQRPTIKRR